MIEKITCTGNDLNGMFNTGTRLLERNVQFINALNVFPVPDGDTGINMLLTMRAAMEEVERSSDKSVSSVTQAIAKGSLMGARGNSGVILSQIFRGFAQGLDGKSEFDGCDLAAALILSSDYAYRSVSKPEEGTILTVIREVATAAKNRSIYDGTDVLSIMETIVEEARASVARTPTLLPVLQQAGVVDAGGQGLYVVFRGALSYLRGKTEDLEVLDSAYIPSTFDTVQQSQEKDQYGYCTEFLLYGSKIDTESVREKLVSLGESVLVVGDDSIIRVHVHTFDPGAVISYATTQGALRQVKIENMQDQHEDFIASQPQQISTGISTVTVASGEGLSQAFISNGATVVVPGGDSMNPSVEELLRAVNSAPSDDVILLPNNPNVLLAADQVKALSEKEVEIVPSETIPQGVAALLAVNCENDLKTNVSAMKKALSSVHSGGITRAVRSMELGGLSIREGQIIAFLEGKPVFTDDNMLSIIHNLLDKMDIEDSSLVTLYYGANTDTQEANEIVESIENRYKSVEVELVAGGQPHYNYIISVE